MMNDEGKSFTLKHRGSEPGCRERLEAIYQGSRCKYECVRFKPSSLQAFVRPIPILSSSGLKHADAGSLKIRIDGMPGLLCFRTWLFLTTEHPLRAPLIQSPASLLLREPVSTVGTLVCWPCRERAHVSRCIDMVGQETIPSTEPLWQSTK